MRDRRAFALFRPPPRYSCFSAGSQIYALLRLSLCRYTAILPAHTEAARLLTAVGPWFIVSCVFNIAWIVTFSIATPAAVTVSTVLLFSILISLLVVIMKIDSWRSVRASLWDVWIIDVTFSLYAGWCTVACIANVVISCTAYGWFGAPWTEQGWSALMISVAAAVNVAVLATRHDPVFALVFSWAAAAIASGHSDEHDVFLAAAVTSGLVCAGAVGVIIFHIVRWAGRLQNRAKKTYNPADPDHVEGGNYSEEGRK